MKMGGSKLLALCLLGLLAASAFASSNSQRRRLNDNQRSGNSEEDSAVQTQQQRQAKPFQSGYEYTFAYNAQISTGLASKISVDGVQQKAATRIQAQAKISFQSASQATFRLEQIRIGQLNKLVDEPQKVQPLGMFEQKQIAAQKRQELEMPCSFEYAEGVIARLQCGEKDPVWSKNIKRAVLNLIQLNLKENNAQGINGDADLIASSQQMDQSSESGEQQQRGQQINQAFVIPEITLEGQCLTTYTINNNRRQNQQQDSSAAFDEDFEQQCGSAGCKTFNVTKSIDFKQCKKIADVAYGFQTQQPQPQCAQCQQQWYSQWQKNQQTNAQGQQPHPCQQCDPKEIKEQKLDRSTVLRFVLAGKPQKYAIQRAELVSQYVFKNLRVENDNQYASYMHSVVASELVFHDAQKIQGQKQQVQSGRDETLLYDNSWDVDEKRFYMNGDAQQNNARKNPFRSVTNKVEQAQALLRKLVVAASDKSNGIETTEVVQLQRLVEILRMCTVDELKQIQQGVVSSRSSASTPDQQKGDQILANCLAIAGTRNTIFVLVEKIQNNQLSTAKAVQALKALGGLPAPSDAQADILLKLCNSEIAHRSIALKQTCWLSFGAMIGELCQHKTQKNAQQSAYGFQSGFDKDEICPSHKKTQYRKELVKQFTEAESSYEKILALKAIGNSGLDIAVSFLEKIIQDRTESRVVRAQAIDSLRRLRTQMPRKIQRLLLPIFLNTREHSEVRMAAFSMVMHSTPEQPIVDQIAYALTKEPCQQTKGFVYSTMKSLAKSQVPAEQTLAKHLKNALKLANVDEQSLRSSSRRFQVPIYSQNEKEGVFVNLVSVFANRYNMIPAHMAASLDTMLNDEFEINNVKISFSQQEIQQWYERMAQKMSQNYQQGSSSQSKTRGQRSTSSRRGQQMLGDIFSNLKIKSRRGYEQQSQQQQGQEQQGQEQPFAMISIRIGDVDHVIAPVDPQMNSPFKQMLNGQRPSLSAFVDWLEQEGQHFRIVSALNLNEKSAKIATSMGLPLRILQAVPILASVEGQLKLSSSKVHLTAQPSITITHLQKMEAWLPAIIVTGCESYRGIELNIPVQAEAQMSREDGMKITIKTPQAAKTRVLGLHSLPTTFTRDFDSKTNMLREPKVKSVHAPELEQLQRDIKKTVGEHAFGMPFHVRGHYYWPVQATDYKQVVQLLMCTENHVHVTYEPKQDAPNEIVIRANGNLFQKTQQSSSHAPELNDFYSSSSKFVHAYPEDFEDMQLESHDERRQKLNNFLGGFKPSKLYMHELKLTAVTKGGRKESKGEMKVQGVCDAKFKYCKMNVQVERSAMFAEENTDWTLKSQIQILRPDTVASVEQLGELKNAKFVCLAETEWGAGRTQMINLRIQGESAKSKQWRQQIENAYENQGSSQQQLEAYKIQLKKRTAFLNKFDVIADYKLQPSMQNAFNRLFEVVKSYNFWTTSSQLQQSAHDGKVYATVIIDPVSQKHANVSIKTPTQSVRIQSIGLPSVLAPVRPFQLVRRQSAADQSTHSVSQLFSQLAVKGRAQCTVDGKSVQTFDGIHYRAPIGNCYSVLAKDCTSNEPQFVVMMKALGNQGQDQSGQTNKKLKVVTPDAVIECQPASTLKNGGNSNGQLVCTINGQQVNYGDCTQDQCNECYGDNCNNQQCNNNGQCLVEFNGEEQTQVTINVQGVQVQFGCWCNSCDCQKVWIRIANLYKNGQCGLCGHYDDSVDDEWRMNNDELTDDLSKFHQSFSMQTEQCNEQQQKNFYKSQKENFGIVSSSYSQKKKRGAAYRLALRSYNNQEESDEQDAGYGSDEQSNWGSSKQQQGQKKQRWGNGASQEQDAIEPVSQTKVIEYTHKICFSVEPVKQCPEGSYPLNGRAAYDSQEENEQQQKQGAGRKMQYVCYLRSSIEARRLQRQARRGVVVDVSNKDVTFTEMFNEPTQCIEY